MRCGYQPRAFERPSRLLSQNVFDSDFSLNDPHVCLAD